MRALCTGLLRMRVRPVLPLPVRPDPRRRALPDADLEGHRDPRGPARAHERARRPDLRRRRAGRRRQDPGRTELPPPPRPEEEARGLRNYQGRIFEYREPTGPRGPDAEQGAARRRRAEVPVPRARAARERGPDDRSRARRSAGKSAWVHRGGPSRSASAGEGLRSCGRGSTSASPRTSVRSSRRARAGGPVRGVRLPRDRRRDRRSPADRSAIARGSSGGGRKFLEAVLADPPDLVLNLAEGRRAKPRRGRARRTCPPSARCSASRSRAAIP
jgi:hypothetical protein